MVTATAQTLRRMTGAGRPPPEIASLTPEKALRLAFGRAGRALPALALRLTGFAMERTTAAGLAAALPDLPLLLLLCRHGEGAAGAAVLDAGLRSALVEVETTGALGRGPAADRPATRIDAVLAAGFLDGALAVFDDLAADLSIAPAVTGFRLGEVLSSPRALPLVLADIPYRLFRLEFDLGEGARQGRLLLAMPELGSVPKRDAAPGLSGDLAAAVMAAPAELRVVLVRLRLPLERVTAWQPGEVIDLPREALDAATIEDITGEVVGRGRLGRQGGHRAVRLQPEAG